MAKDPTNYPSDAADKYVLRFPDGMRDRLKELAAQNARTLNAEIVHRLQATLDAERDTSKDVVFSRRYKAPEPDLGADDETEKEWTKEDLEKSLVKLDKIVEMMRNSLKGY